MTDLFPIENPADVMTRACQVLVMTGHGKLADRLHYARERVEKLADAASKGDDQEGEYAVTPGLWFGPQRATVLRDALAPFELPAKEPDHA